MTQDFIVSQRVQDTESNEGASSDVQNRTEGARTIRRGYKGNGAWA